MNTTRNTLGRFSNQFIRNMACHFIAKKYNVYFTYSIYSLMKKFGIHLFTDGAKFPIKDKEVLIINDSNLCNLIKEPNHNISYCNIKPHELSYFQTREFAFYLRYHFNNIRERTIIPCNKFTTRYNNNNDAFVHVRLGDVSDKHNPPFEYYDKVLSQISFINGYIASDSINHDICRKLIHKYKLNIINQNEVNTIMFGNTCKYIILSGGTFSWLIGLFGFYSTIYYPKKYLDWHGDIFVFPDWNGID